MTVIKYSGFNFGEIREMFLKGLPGVRAMAHGLHELEINYNERIFRPEVDENKIAQWILKNVNLKTLIKT